MTVKAVAKEMEFSEAKLFRMEAGDTSMRALEVERMCQIYGAAPEITESLIALARETKAKGWWHSYNDIINEDFAAYIGLEETADHLAWYESDLVPGLLQTEDYARAILTMKPSSSPALDDSEAVERSVQFRISRQRVLTRPTAPVTLQVVLGEAIIRRPLGGRNTLAGQLQHLLDRSDLPNVEIKVMPHHVGEHAGIISGPFVLLQFPATGPHRLAEPPTVYVDQFLGTLYLDQPTEIAMYEAAWADLWATALSENQSRDFISKALKEIPK